MNLVECGWHKLIGDTTIVAGGRVLLVTYANDNPFLHPADAWALPHQRLEHLVHPDDNARLIARTHVGLDLDMLELGFIESFGGTDQTWHLAFHYVARLDVEPTVTHARFVASHAWFPLDALPPVSEVAHGGWQLDAVRKLGRRGPFGA